MERKRFRPSCLSPLSRVALAVALLGGLPACSSPLDNARIAWDDGEGNFENAERYYKEAIEKGGAEGDIAKEELHDLNLLLAQDLHKTRARDAERHYRNAIELDPDSEGAREGLAKLLMTQYRHDEALEIVKEGADRGTCRGCKRLVAVMMSARADARYREGDYAGAESDYAQAAGILPDAHTALGLARSRIALQNVAGATAALEEAASHIGRDDMQQREQFLELRHAAVLVALEKDDVKSADALLDLAPIGVSATAQLGLAIEVSMRFSAMGKPDEALSRMQALVEAADAGKLSVSETRKEELRDKVADLLAARAIQRLNEGDEAQAKSDIADALKLRPNNTNVALLNALLVAGSGDIPGARNQLRKVPDGAPGKIEVRSILYAMDVETYLKAGRLKDARTSLDYAKRGGEDLPEVHVASAQILAQTEAEGLSKDDEKALKKDGLVKYPKGKIVRAGEAMSELSWAENATKAENADWPFRGPGLQARIDGLRSDLGEFYPYVVEFRKDGNAVLVFENKGAEDVQVKVSGKGASGSATVKPGESAEIPVSKPGVVTLEYGGKARAFLAEPYTKVHLPV